MKPDLHFFDQQGDEIRLVTRRLAEGKMMHASLITGGKGTGKRTFASLVASALLCSSDGEKPCGICRDCVMSFAMEHPDLILIRQGIPLSQDVKKERSTIPIDDIREMIRICGTSTFSGRNRVVLIFDADRMTPQAQNCLLKTLEEPPAGTYFLLVTEHPESLAATIVSRCTPIRMKSWRDDIVMGILLDQGIGKNRASESVAQANGSIGKALELASDEEYWKFRNEVIRTFFNTSRRSMIISVSNEWKDRKNEAERLLGILESMISRMIHYRDHHVDAQVIESLPDNWQRFVRNAGPERIIHLTEAIRSARKQIQFNVNFQTVLEQIMFVFMGEGNEW